MSVDDSLNDHVIVCFKGVVMLNRSYGRAGDAVGLLQVSLVAQSR